MMHVKFLAWPLTQESSQQIGASEGADLQPSSCFHEVWWKDMSRGMTGLQTNAASAYGRGLGLTPCTSRKGLRKADFP